MRNTNVKNNKEFLGIIILCILALVAGVLALNFGGTSLYAHAAEIECCDNNEHEHSTQTTFSNLNGNVVLEQKYLSAHYADGTMGMILDETYDPDEVVFEPFAYTHLQRTTVMSSGKPDNQSIVAVFLGDGFDSSDADQNLFLDRVDEIAKYMITVEPFNYYKDYLTVYAVHSISTDSGISGEAGGAFACRNAAGNPATPQCTPVDSAVFNCTHGRDTFYNSYYQWRSSAGRVILEMSTANRTRARNHALAACSSANMVQVIANSAMRGGTGEMPTATQPLGVALTSINTANPNGDWKQVTMHEFGHTFGGLWDEYWNGLTFDNKWPNITNNTNAATVKWSQWVGYKNVGVYPFANSDWDNGNHDQATNPWFRPHQNCMMRQTSNPFCAVCVHELLGRMATATGFTLFNTTNTGTNNIRIDKLNISVSGTFDIPERINGMIVTEIGSSAFANAGMSQISIPSSITNIGTNAFSGCTNLSITWSYNPSLTAANFKAYLTQVNFPDGITTISANAFVNCAALSQITIPASITSIGASAFDGCVSLAYIYVNSNNPYYSSQTGILYNKAKTEFIHIPEALSRTVEIPNGIISIPNGAFFYRTGLTRVTIPSGVNSIGEYAFYGCHNLNYITIPDSVSHIGKNAFYNTGMWNTTDSIKYADKWVIGAVSNGILRDGTVGIADYAFNNNRYLAGIEIPASVKHIGNGAFADCNYLQKVTFEQGSRLNIIGDSAFTGTKLNNIDLPLSVTSIGGKAFYNCAYLTAIEIPANVTYIGNNAFDYCGAGFAITWHYNPALRASSFGAYLKKVIIPSDVTIIRANTFEYCSALESIDIPSNVTRISDYAFRGCASLKSVNFTGDSKLTAIDHYAFYNCGSLDKFIIPESVTYIGVNVFYGCRALEITWYYNPALTANGFENYLKEVIVPDSVYRIGDEAFYNCVNLENVTIGKNVTSIGYRSFYNCPYIFITWRYNPDFTGGGIKDKLNTLYIPSNVTKIGYQAFYGCASLERVIFEEDSCLEEIEGYAFWYCTALREITIPYSVTEIGWEVFKGCDSLTIYAEAASRPQGWSDSWNPDYRPVFWGFAG